MLTISMEEKDEEQDPLSELLEQYDAYDACSWSVPPKSNEQQLMEASANGLLGDVRTLLTQEVNVDWQDEQGETSLIVSSRAGHPEVVKELLNREANSNIQNNTGWTALICACHWGYVEIVERLLKGGAKVNIRSHRGWSALHTAAHWGHVSVLRLLLEHSADWTIKDFDGKMAKDIARENEDIEIVTILEESERRYNQTQIMQRIDSTPQLMIKALEEEIRLLKQEVHELKKGERILILHKDGSVQENQYDVQTEIDRVQAENAVIRAENIRFRVLFESLQSKLNTFVI